VPLSETGALGAAAGRGQTGHPGRPVQALRTGYRYREQGGTMIEQISQAAEVSKVGRRAGVGPPW